MFCSKCGRQINNDALFCTFCGSPTMLAAPTAPAAPAVPNANALNAPNVPSTPNMLNVPTPQSIPMTSESYAASAPLPSAGAVSQSVPVYAEQGSEPVSPPEEYAEALPTTEQQPVSEEPENDGLSLPPVYEPSEYGEDPEAQLPEPEQPALPAPQPAFAVRESSELAAVNPAGTIDFSAPIQPVQPAPPAEETGKRYTFGHIALCLAAVGVMAVVAGIFAGLYFSVI